MKFNKILDILYPRRCPVCGDITGGSGRMICPDCLRKLSFVKSPVCKKCGKEIEDESMEFCPDCMRHPRAFEYGIALLNYDEAARHSMAQIKYNNKREYLDFYGTALAWTGTGTRASAGRCPGPGAGPCHEEKDPGIQSGRDPGSGHRKEAGDSGNTGNAGEK